MPIASTPGLMVSLLVSARFRPVGAVVARSLDMGKVTGSSPVGTTKSSLATVLVHYNISNFIRVIHPEYELPRVFRMVL